MVDNHSPASPAFSLKIPPLDHFLQQPKKPPVTASFHFADQHAPGTELDDI